VPVAILDHTARAALFPDDTDPLGQTVLIGNMHAVVIGVLDADEHGADSLPQAHIYVPATALAVRLTGAHYFPYVLVKLKDGISFEQVESKLEQLLEARHGRKDFHLISYEKYIRAYIRNADMLNLLMLIVAVISLAVAGIGVMNIMLVSVTERTNEIGIRMAVGARQPDIRRQFMSEAVLVCTLGGALGIGLSIALVHLVPLIAPSIQLHLSMTVIVFACFISTLVGIGFGYFPARNAARLDPIRALIHHG
jgi:macrolide transport system ATP-binding/permease protein